MRQDEELLEAKGGSSWRQFVKTGQQGCSLEDQPEVPNGFSAESMWA